MMNRGLIRGLLRESLVSELRSHSDTNVGEDFNTFLNRVITRKNYKRSFVSFRSDEYVTDINPNNVYGTPSGVYCYPIMSYFDYDDLSDINEKNFRKAFPYMSHQKVVQIIILDNLDNVLDSGSGPEKVFGYVKKIRDLYGKINPINNLCDLFLNGEYHSTYEKAKHLTHNFWLFLYDVVPYISSNSNSKKSDLRIRITLLCKKIGLDGFIDWKGDKFIHQAEPKQAVFFGIKNKGEIYNWVGNQLKFKSNKFNYDEKWKSEIHIHHDYFEDDTEYKFKVVYVNIDEGGNRKYSLMRLSDYKLIGNGKLWFNWISFTSYFGKYLLVSMKNKKNKTIYSLIDMDGNLVKGGKFWNTSYSIGFGGDRLYFFNESDSKPGDSLSGHYTFFSDGTIKKGWQ